MRAASSVTVGDVVPACNTATQRYSTAMAYLQPLASVLAEMPPAKFQSALVWLESVYTQCITGEWELCVSMSRTTMQCCLPFTTSFSSQQ